jgi:anti-sigma factor RsiW
MSECRRTVEQLTPYLDGMLTPLEGEAVERHLGGCPPCRRLADAASGGRTVLRHCADTLRQGALPPGLRSRCEALTRPEGAPGWRRHLIPALAVAALVMATGLALFSMASRRYDTVLAQQLTLDHLKCFHFFASPGSAITDAPAAERLLAARYGWDLHVPPSSPRDGVSLISARRCLYASGTIPHLMYRVNGHDMSLFVLDRESRREAEVVTLGHASRIWSRGEKTYVLVAPRGAGDLTPAARYVMQYAP